MINADFKESLPERTANLPLIPNRSRSFISCGAYSVILKDGHHQALIITDHLNAAKIDLMASSCRIFAEKHPDQPIPKSLLMPTLLGAGQDLRTLIDPTKPEKVKKQFNTQLKHLKSSIWEDNVIFQVDLYDGDLDAFLYQRFKEDSISVVMKALHEALDYLHNIGLTHNDINLKNCLFKGTYPKFKVCLTDFGSVTYNVKEVNGKVDLKYHHEKIKSDLMKLNLIETKLRKKLETIIPSPIKKLPSPSKKAKAEGRPQRASAREFYKRMQQAEQNETLLDVLEASPTKNQGPSLIFSAENPWQNHDMDIQAPSIDVSEKSRKKRNVNG